MLQQQFIIITQIFHVSKSHLVSKVSGGLSVNCEAHCEYQNVGQGGDDAQHHSIPQLKWQHGVYGEDDEEEERHLETKIFLFQ